MSLMIRLAIGTFDGLDGTEILQLLANLPEGPREDIDAIWRQNRRADLALTELGLRRLEGYLWGHMAAAGAIVRKHASCGRPTLDDDSDDDEGLRDHLPLLNIVARKVNALQRSVVLRGFLHDSECASYWEYPDDPGIVPDAYRIDHDECAIRMFTTDSPVSNAPAIHILDSVRSLPLDDLNRSLRRGTIPPVLRGKHRARVLEVRAGRVKLRSVRGWDRVHDILPGPGCSLTMMDSLDRAVRILREPDVRVVQSTR